MNKETGQTVAQALQHFYDKHQYGEEGGMYERFAWIKFGFVSIPILNVPGRRKNVYLHDINHLITGYDVTWKGETALSAWEVASGGWGNVYVIWIMALWAIGLGVVLYPRNVLKAFRRGQTMKNALTCGLTKDEMYQLPVDELRKRFINSSKNNTYPFVWMAAGLLVFTLPLIVIGLTISIIIN